MIIALPVVLIEMGIIKFIGEFNLPFLATSILNMVLGVAFVEEFIKYLVVREKALNHREFDEPIDAIIYMITVAMGFAAIENILILFSLGPEFFLRETLSISAFRFLGATFLHALCSGTLGYFLALSICQKNTFLFVKGLLIATLLHGIYNSSIIGIKGAFSFLIPAIILLSLAIYLAFALKRLAKIRTFPYPREES